MYSVRLCSHLSLLLISYPYVCLLLSFFFFFFNDTAPTEIYTLSLHDALPIYQHYRAERKNKATSGFGFQGAYSEWGDRKSTRLNSSHRCISYAVFCLKKKKTKKIKLIKPESKMRQIKCKLELLK